VTTPVQPPQAGPCVTGRAVSLERKRGSMPLIQLAIGCSAGPSQLARSALGSELWSSDLHPEASTGFAAG